MFQGTLTALITPFKNGQVDEEALRAIVDWQIAEGIHGLVACGTTGEAAAMSAEERLLVVRHVVDQARGRVPVLAGVGTNNIKTTLELARKAANLKADGILVVTPYYVKPPQRGMLDFFAQVAQVGLPLVAYNVPGRTSIGLSVESVAALSRLEGVVAIKEATGDLKLASQMMLAADKKFGFLSGDDFTFLPFLALGGQGAISVVSNIAPRQMAGIYDKHKAGQHEEALALHRSLFPLMEELFVESNPIPIKEAMHLAGRCDPEVRAPLARLEEKYRGKLRALLLERGLI